MLIKWNVLIKYIYVPLAYNQDWKFWNLLILHAYNYSPGAYNYSLGLYTCYVRLTVNRMFILLKIDFVEDWWSSCVKKYYANMVLCDFNSKNKAS